MTDDVVVGVVAIIDICFRYAVVGVDFVVDFVIFNCK